MTETNHTPDNQPTIPIEPAAPVEPTTAAAAPAPKRRGRLALIAGGAVLGAALLAGGGVAVGAAIADDDDDDDRASARVDDRTGTTGATGATDAPGTTGTTGTTASAWGAASADELDEVAQAASAVAEGQPVSIDANRDGSWDVTLRGADGGETEVRVAADGSAAVRETEAPDGDDTAPRNILDAATLRSIVDAALAESAAAGGRVVDVDADDDSRSPFDVTILVADGRTVDVELDAAGAVLRTDLDD
ncbi:hypothetical protein [Microbacterium radiodurans]|uniref:PepSY domain-containing protein n=1 Tax=Microbacterium radiodurans TaxID=661398 RepID=A0A5J5IWI8_9MICO|nr:hypothetical protein [Microbacterium radiodurans]KAA9089185.1 hypothetical protein F6B42_01420 [Microbacterium radiodurans]